MNEENKDNQKAEAAKQLLKDINHSAIKKCYECRGCENDCPSFQRLEGYDPTRLNKDILDYKITEWLGSDMIWQCLECHTCTEMCPQGYSWEKVFLKFKALAMKLGIAPRSVGKGMEFYKETGMLATVKSLRARTKLNLPEMKKNGSEDFKVLYEQLKRDGE